MNRDQMNAIGATNWCKTTHPTTVNFEGLARWSLQYMEPVFAESEQRKE